MKKGLLLVVSIIVSFSLAGCGNSISQEDLMQHPWKLVMEDDDDDSLSFNVKFTKKNLKMTLASDDSNDEEDEDDLGLFSGLTDMILGMVEMSFSYELNGNKLNLYNDENDQEIELELKKDGDNIKMTELSGESDDDKSGFHNAVLEPLKESKESDSDVDSSTEDFEEDTEDTESYFEDDNETDASLDDDSDSSDLVEGKELPLPSKTEFSTKEVNFKITQIKIIAEGEIGNEYGDTPVLAIWYNTTNNTSNDNTPMDWVSCVTATQDNDPNKVNELSLGSSPDEALLDDQSATIKKGGTLASAVAYELTDTTTKVTLKFEDYTTSKEVGEIDINLQ